MTYQKYLELASTYLKLTTVNELLQTFRVNSQISEALLKTLAMLGKTFEKGENSEANADLSKDLTVLLLKFFTKTEIGDNLQAESILKLSI